MEEYSTGSSKCPPMAALDKKRKQRPPPSINPPAKRHKSTKDAPSTSALPKDGQKGSNLTLHDWLTVYQHCDSLPEGWRQSQVVEHFRNRKEDPLIFDQSTLSRKIKQRKEIEERVKAYPGALSSRRLRVVTAPQVEQALALWVQQMLSRKATVSVTMLIAKREWFEAKLDVNEEDKLKGNGWVKSFCKA